MAKATHTYTHNLGVKGNPPLSVRLISEVVPPKDAFEGLDCTTYHLDMGSVKTAAKIKTTWILAQPSLDKYLK